MPSVVELNDETRHHAMYALHDPVYGLKAGAHTGATWPTPTSRSRRPCARRARSPAGCASASRTSTRSPSAPRPASTRSPRTRSFVLERRGRLVVGSACSGHGFKFAPAVGRRLAGAGARLGFAAMPFYQRLGDVPAQAPHPVPRERDAPHRRGDGPRGLHRQRVDPLPPAVAVPRDEARRLRADRARGVGARPARAPALQDVRRQAGGRRDHRPPRC